MSEELNGTVGTNGASANGSSNGTTVTRDRSR